MTGCQKVAAKDYLLEKVLRLAMLEERTKFSQLGPQHDSGLIQCSITVAEARRHIAGTR